SRTAGYLRETLGDSTHFVGIALDEWGVWHPEARSWGPDNDIHREPITYEQAGTQRDAIAAAIALDGFHRQCHVLTLANLAQIVNVLHAPVMTDGARIWLTPTYYALQLHTPHIGATALPVEVTQSTSQPGSDDSISAVTATASVKDGRTAVTFINRHYDQPSSVTLVALSTKEAGLGQLLAADPRAVNSLDQAERVKPEPLPVYEDGIGRWRVELPPCSMATVQFS